jgi:exodeoxyribonuclease VII large subunit
VPEAEEIGPRIYSVGELVGGLRRLLEERVGRLYVVGEVSNLRRPASGHLYFTLKDDCGQIAAALFRATARQLAFEPEEGLEVIVYGEVTVYEPRGDLQIVVRQLEPRGVGALQLAFEQLRRRLEAEGLFDPQRKRPLPERPARVGVVTSPSGAALRDVLQVSGRRWPDLPIRIAPARVQGPGAEHEIAQALDALGDHGECDVVLLVRGGGSLEDLQPFNTEIVARALARCAVPVVSGVAHEVDVTIADLAADVRAPTPSAAAELAVPDREAMRAELASLWGRFVRAGWGLVSARSAQLTRGSDALRAHAPASRLAAGRTRLHAADRALVRAVRAGAERARSRLEALAGRLDSLSPLSVLGRGYALVRRAGDGAIVRRAADAPAGERLHLRVAEASIEAVVESAGGLADDEKIL